MAAALDEDDDNRWKLQEELAKVFKISLKRTLGDHTKVVFRISTCTKEDDGDYVCKSKLNIHTKILKKGIFEDLQHVGLAIIKNLPASASDMMERCVVCGPGYVKFTLSRQWIAKNIHKMLTDGIDTWAYKLPMRKAIIDFSSRNVLEEHDFGHLRSAIIVDTLARIIEFSKVEVIRRSHLKDNEIRRKRYEKVYELLGIRMEEKSKSLLYNIYIPALLHLLREKGLIKTSEGDEVMFIDGKKLPLVKRDGGYYKAFTDLAALWHGLNTGNSEWIIYVTNEDQREYIDMCFIAAKFAGWTSTYKGIYPIVQVGFGPVQGDDLKRFQNCNNQIADLLDEAKTRCKAALVEQGKADKWSAEELDRTAEALGHGAVKYENLKSDRFTTYTFSFDLMLDDKGNTAIYLQYTHARICSIIRKSGEEIEELKRGGEMVLKNDEERKLGLHLLRFIEVVRKVCLVHLPDMLCEYIYDLSKKFNSLYSDCKDLSIGAADEDTSIGESGDETSIVGSDKTTINLLLCEATAVVMRKCFHLMGITPIYKI